MGEIGGKMEYKENQIEVNQILKMWLFVTAHDILGASISVIFVCLKLLSYVFGGNNSYSPLFPALSVTRLVEDYKKSKCYPSRV